MSECALCDEEIEETDKSWTMPFVDADGVVNLRDVHKECIVRTTLGGIGHHEDHDYWCGHMHDPDGGRSYHQSAIEVVALLKERGIEGMV